MSMTTDTGASSAPAGAVTDAANNSLLTQDSQGAVTDTLMGSSATVEPGKAAAASPDKKNAQGAGEKPSQSSEPVVGLAPLPDNADDSQRADFDKKLRALAGVPSTAADYGNFGFGDEVKIDMAGEDYGFYTKLFHEVGLTKAQAKRLLEQHSKRSGEQLEHMQKQKDQVITDYRAQVKRDFVKSLGGEAQFSEFKDTAIRGFQDRKSVV